MAGLRSIYKKVVVPLAERRLQLASFNCHLRATSLSDIWFYDAGIRSGADAVLEVLDEFSDVSARFPPTVDSRWLNPAAHPDRWASAPTFDSLTTVVAAAATARAVTSGFVETTLRLCFCVDRATELFRTLILGEPIAEVPDDDGSRSKSKTRKPKTVDDEGVQSAALDAFTRSGRALRLREALDALAVAIEQPLSLQLFPSAQIDAIKPTTACGGARVSISGTGFGDSPSDGGARSVWPSARGPGARVVERQLGGCRASRWCHAV